MKKSCLPLLPSRKYKLDKVTTYATMHIRKAQTSKLDNAKLRGGQRKGKGMQEKGTLGPSAIPPLPALHPAPRCPTPLCAPPYPPRSNPVGCACSLHPRTLLGRFQPRSQRPTTSATCGRSCAIWMPIETTLMEVLLR